MSSASVHGARASAKRGPPNNNVNDNDQLGLSLVGNHGNPHELAGYQLTFQPWPTGSPI